MITNEEALPIVTDAVRRVAEARGITGSTANHVRHKAIWVLTDLLFPQLIESGEWDGVVQRATKNADSLPRGWDVSNDRTRRAEGEARRAEASARRAQRGSGYVPSTPMPFDPRPCACGCGGQVYLKHYQPGHDTRHLHATVRGIVAGTKTPAAGFQAMQTPSARERLAGRLEAKGVVFDPSLTLWVGPTYCVQGHEMTPENTARGGYCRTCTTIHQGWFKSEYRAIADAAKSQPCVDCGQSYDPRAMDLDHLPEFDKVAGVADMVMKPSSYTKQQLEEEIAKCEAVCANCHVLRTESRRNPSRRINVTGHWAARNAWYIAQKASPCVDCGIQYPAPAMEFDHLPGYTKTAKVSAMVRGRVPERVTLLDGSTRPFTIEEIALEIAKCELVCVCCHRIRTASRGAWTKAAS